ncbi:hypothetical protein MalM25_17400 [Planctomycetes bacterium MalM25]|nr:hypothetical protein MalM25_17400 [Planctomycetes bacterium MalM25]
MMPLPRRTSRNATTHLAAMLLLLCGPAAEAIEKVRAEMGVQDAWVGERAPFYVTLHSRGPFSGVATFELPELPRTVIVKLSSPLIGSESIEGETWLSQRHEFAVYTWRQGEVTIPPFTVRFRSKPSYTADDESTEASTSELRFESRLPPDVAPGDEVLPTTELTFAQAWSPERVESVQPGDVIERTLTRRAEGATAMMLPPLEPLAQDGIKVYEGTPKIQDRTERGASTAERLEVFKYQFVRPGTYELPPLTVRWWDTTQEKLRQSSVPGMPVRVAAPPTNSAGTASGGAVAFLYLPFAMLSLAAAAWLTRSVWRSWIVSETGSRHAERTAARRVLAACRDADPGKAYRSTLEWLRAVEVLDTEGNTSLNLSDAFERQWKSLSRVRYGGRPKSTWGSRDFAIAFKEQRKRLFAPRRTSLDKLAPLNPTS